MRRGSFHYLIVPGWHGSPEDHWQSHWQRTLPHSQRIEQAEPLRNFAPLPLAPLPFPSVLVGSDNDPAASADRARAMGKVWGSEVSVLNGVGHINVASGHHRWEEGLVFLDRLQSLLNDQSRRRA